MSDSELAVWAFTRPGGRSNFGDELGPAILQRLGYRVRRVRLGQADLIPGGSVIDHAAKAAKAGAMIWGAGLMHGAPLDTGRTGTGRLRFLAVRGQMTANLLDLGREIPRADPGTMVAEFWGRTPVRHKLGVVPHYVDDRAHPWADLVIDVSAPVDEVIAQITSCATIASSSLHGLIVAQAYGIPVMRLPHPRVAGGDFKWLDHLTGTATPDDLIGALP